MDTAKGFLDQDITRRFSDRIAESLAREPVALQPSAHREKLKALMESLGEMSFYELLNVQPAAHDDEIHEAYSDLARIVHPSHASNLGMSSSRAALELLFERATEAYLTLNDPDRSRVYQMATGMTPGHVPRPTAEQRRAEQKDQGERFFGVARKLVAEARYYDAVQTLQQAVNLDPRPEYYTLLGECLSHNPHWLQESIHAYQSAVELSPHDARLRSQFGHVLERTGDTRRATEQYRTALSLDPDTPDAEAGLERFGSKRREAEQAARPWNRIKAFLNRSISKGRLR